MWQKSVLLGAIEAMNLIDEQDGTRAVSAGFFRVGHHLLDFFDPGKHGGKLYELSFGDMCDDLRQRGLARARRSPEDDGAGIVTLNLQAERLARADDVLLADKLVERARTHTVGQEDGRLCLAGPEVPGTKTFLKTLPEKPCR